MKCSNGSWRRGWIFLGAAAVILAPWGHRSEAAPPGSKIAFAVEGADSRTSRIYVANADGSNAHPVTPGTTRERAPAFSPSGQSLAYHTTDDLGLDRVMVQRLDGAAPRFVAQGSFPQWSRDGKRLLFARRNRMTNKDSLFVIRADGSEKEADLKPIADGRLGRWSPDEGKLAVVGVGLKDGKEVWRIQVLSTAEAAAKTTSSFTLGEEWGPVVSMDWSPDGKRLLFSFLHQPKYEMYVLDLEAPDPRRVPAADTGQNAAYGTWSPEGDQILFREAADTMNPAPTGNLSRLCLMKADGTNVRVLWEPQTRMGRIQGTAWFQPVTVAAVPKPTPPVVKPEVPPVKPPPVTPVPPVPVMPPAVGKVLGPPQKLQSSKLFSVAQERSPISVSMAVPGPADFVVSIPVLPANSYTGRRQGVGITLDMEDGSLYRGNFIFSDSPWITLQGRARGAKVQMIDGKKLSPQAVGFKKGFTLSLRREGNNLIVALDGQDVLSRPVLMSGVKTLSLTLENFDNGAAQVPLGNVYYREWVPGEAAMPQTTEK